MIEATRQKDGSWTVTTYDGPEAPLHRFSHVDTFQDPPGFAERVDWAKVGVVAGLSVGAAGVVVGAVWAVCELVSALWHWVQANAVTLGIVGALAAVVTGTLLGKGCTVIVTHIRG